MHPANELENDLALAVLVHKNDGEQIDLKAVLPLIGRIREVLGPISSKDHSYTDATEGAQPGAAEH